MRDMKIGDKAFFYHSNCKQPGIVGIIEVSRVSPITFISYIDALNTSYWAHVILLVHQ